MERIDDGSKRIVLVTPIYKVNFDHWEQERMRISLVFNGHLHHIFLAPRSLNISWYRSVYPLSKFIFRADSFFININGYNSLMLSRDLYSELSSIAPYTCILQPDALLFKDILSLDFERYDYIGSVWPKGLKINLGLLKKNRSIFDRLCYKFGSKALLHVGNGGLSIRNNRTFEFITHIGGSAIDQYAHEDVYFSYMLNLLALRVPPSSVADEIFAEWSIVNKSIKEIGSIYGCHGIDKVSKSKESEIMSHLKTFV